MLNVGLGELFAILALALIVLGPAKLPDAVRTAGRVMGELRRISGGFQQQLRDALEEGQVDEEPEPLRDTRPAASIDQAVETASTPTSTTSRTATATSHPDPTGPAAA